MRSLIQAGIEVIHSQDDLESADREHRFIEILTFSSFDEIVDLLDQIDARYWTEFPVWARNLAYRLASLLEPQNAEIRERAAMGLRSFGPDWDGEANRLDTEAVALRRKHREPHYAH